MRGRKYSPSLTPNSANTSDARRAGGRPGPGDVLVFTTDGVWEAQNGCGERFCRERLGQVVRELSPRDPPELIRGIERAVCAHAHPQPLRDDLSLLALRHDLDRLI